MKLLKTLLLPALAAVGVLLTAIQQDDYAAFTADGDAAFRAITRPALSEVSAQLAPRLSRGYQTTYLGTLHKQGFQVSLWKLTFKDGGDDALATLSLKAGSVGGFFVN